MSVTIPDRLRYRKSLVIRAMVQGATFHDALKAGGWGDWAARNPGAWLRDHPDVAEKLDKINAEIIAEAQVEALDVLVALVQQAQRLEAMLGYSHRWTEIYDANGSMKPVNEWPEWASHMVSEIETKELFAYSKDGSVEGSSSAWDKIGEAKKIKREETLKIEKELRETWKEIGRHTQVKAFPVPGDKIGEGLSDIANAITAKLQGALAREKRVIDVTPESDSDA